MNKLIQKKNLLVLYISILCFTLDRFSKLYILNLAKLQKLDLSITIFLDLRLIFNKGIAFGMLSVDEAIYYNFITLIIILITLIVLYMSLISVGIQKVAFSMIFGGSTGNIFDRIHYNSVIDFIDVNINGYHWFIFNISDIFITLGVITLIILEFYKKK
jgi:signal peptidase II